MKKYVPALVSSAIAALSTQSLLIYEAVLSPMRVNLDRHEGEQAEEGSYVSFESLESHSDVVLLAGPQPFNKTQR